MATIFDPISAISPAKASWTVKAKVVRLWQVSDFTRQRIPFSMELVLMDEEGARIHASIRKTLIYRFQNDLREGCVYSLQGLCVASNGGSFKTTHHGYKLNFQYSTRVEKLDSASVPGSIYDFVPISDIVGGCFDTDYLVDVIGMLTGVGTEREYEKDGIKTKINVIGIEADGHNVECTLFGPYVDELNTFLASGEVQNVVAVVQFAKVKNFQGKIHIQNSMNSTKLVFNPDSEDALKLRNRMSDNVESPSPLALSQLNQTPKVGALEEFLELTPRKTIEGLKDCTKESDYVVFATVKHIIGDDDWWYTACTCGKGVYPDSKMFFCEKCNRHVMKVSPRYCIKVRVIDQTDSATFVVFDHAAKLLFNKSCADMYEAHDKRSHGTFPKDISGLVDKSFLFKVEYKHQFNSKFEQTFRVKKICSDLEIVQKFVHTEDKDLNSESVYLANEKETMIEGSSSCTTLAKDLMPNFTCAVVDVDSLCDERKSGELSKELEDKTLLKKVCENQQSNMDLETKTGELSKDLEDITPPKKDFETQQSNVDLEIERKSGELSKDLEDITPLKKDCENQQSNMDLEMQRPIKLLKKNIKIEKM